MRPGRNSLAFKSRRDDLFIVRKRRRLFSFCFSAARVNAKEYVERSGPAPLKNKKKFCGAFVFYKQVIPTGFENQESKTHSFGRILPPPPERARPRAQQLATIQCARSNTRAFPPRLCAN